MHSPNDTRRADCTPARPANETSVLETGYRQRFASCLASGDGNAHNRQHPYAP
jgi:hypothetical protein